MAGRQKKLRGSDYPIRPGSFYAWQYLKMLQDHNAVNRIGFDGMFLLWIVVRMEDVKQYAMAPDFFNVQLMLAMRGISEKTLQRVRQKCIDAGYLHYEPGTKSIPGIYWVLEPDNVGNDMWRNPVTSDGRTSGKATGDTPGIRPEMRPPSLPTLKPSTPAPASAAADISESDSKEDTGRDLRQLDHVDSGTVAKAGTDRESLDQLDRGTTPKAGPVRESLDQLDSRTTPEAFLADALHQRGLHLFEETVRQSMDAGFTAEAIADVIDYFDSRPDAWRVGALRRRLISKSAARLSPSDGWPPPSSKEKQRKAAELQQQAQKLSEERQQRERAEQAAKREQLELKFGEEADHLSDDEILELLNEPVRGLFRRNRDRGRVRTCILTALASRAGA